MKDVNLDNMTIEGLWEFYAEGKRIRLFAKEYGLTVRDAKQYRAYAANKAVAMTCRIEGKIEEAREYESICNRIYARMTVKQW